MQTLVFLVLLVAAVRAAPSTYEYAFAVTKDGALDNVERSQFHIYKEDGSYNWGYEFPGRIHLEGRDDQGQVTGSFGYVDANGVLVVNNYKAHPEHGYRVEPDGAAKIAPDSNLAKFRDIVADRLSRKNVEEPVPVQYSTGLEAKPQVPSAEAGAVPTIYLAQNSEGDQVKVAELIGESKEFKNQAQFRVAQDVVDSAGSVSELAFRLNAVPVAAVHDVQMRPQDRITENSHRPVLVHREDVAVPKTYDLLFPVSE